MNEYVHRNELRRQYLDDAVRVALQKYAPAPVKLSIDRDGEVADHVLGTFKGNFPKLHIRLKVEGLYRSTSFQHLLGDVILQFQHGRWHGKGEGQLLVAVYFDRYPPKAERDLADYSKSFLGGQLNWLLVSREGRCGLHLFERDYEFEMDQPLDLPDDSVSSPSTSLFSAKNQWLLKCLLLSGLGPRYWGGPNKVPRTVGELAERAGVPQSTASVFIKAAESADYLRRVKSGFDMIRQRELLDEWHYALKHRPPIRQGVRPLYGPEPEDQWLKRVRVLAEAQSDKPPVAVGSHLACHLLGLGRSNQRGAVLHVQRPFDEIMDRLDLVTDDSDTPWSYLVRWPYAKQVFGGVVVNEAGLPVVDILQAWLDVRQSAARGVEQADHLYNQVLADHFGSKG